MSAAWRYRGFVLVATGFVVALGIVVRLLVPDVERFQAVATIIIQEPVISDEFSGAQRPSIQFVTSQVEIMNSPVVAEEAATILEEGGQSLDGPQILEAMETFSTPESPLVSIVAHHPEPTVAVGIANAVAEGYRQVSQRQATATAVSQLARLDAQIQGVEERLQEIQQERQQLREGDPALSRIEGQAQAAVESIADLQEQLAAASSGEEAATIRQEIDDLRNRIAVFEQVIASPIGPELRALEEEETDQVDRRAQLLTLRDQVAIDAELAADALALVQPASIAEREAGIRFSRVLAVSLVLGLLVGVGGAYFLATWRRTFSDRHEPEDLLAAPMLADIPDFEQESLDSKVPVRDNARSAAAEAYRFASSSLESVATGRGLHSIFAVSSTLGHGKTTTIVNAAIASALQGSSVLVVDCDFGNQAASDLLVGERHAEMLGVTDVVEGVASIDQASHRIELGNGVGLSLMPRGTRPGLAASTLQSRKAREMFAVLGDSFDLVFIDGPPLLQVAYASTLSEFADGLVVVVEHQSRYSEVNDLNDRLALIDTPVLGYIYNRSPLRREMTMTEGSMMDILGDAGMTGLPARRESVRRP